jgi:hypothetical protein
LNIDVLEQDAARKLSGWFDERWEDRRCMGAGRRLISLSMPPVKSTLKNYYR